MTLVQLRTAIRELTMVEGINVADSTITLYINQALLEIGAAERWRWLQSSANVSPILGTQTYAVPTDFDHAIMLTDDDYDTRVPFLSTAHFLASYGQDVGNTGTRATYWTIFNGLIYLHPIPSANDTNRYKLYYYKKVTLLVADGDIPAFHLAFHWAIVEWVKWKLWEREEYFEQAEASKFAFLDQMDKMQAWYDNVIEQEPFMWGDGTRTRLFTDPNIPALDG